MIFRGAYHFLPTASLLSLLITTAVHSSQDDAKEGSPRCSYPVRQINVAGGMSLTLTSPNYPASYDYNSKCGWSLRPVSKNVVLRLSCNEFNLQEINGAGKCPDYLKVQDLRYCGTNSPKNVTATNLKNFKIVFRSNNRENYSGFRCIVTATNPNTDGCSCGTVSKTQPKNDDSTQSSPDESPWLAALVMANTDTVFCSASIIYENWLLTSASCVQRIKYNKYNYEVLVTNARQSLGEAEKRHQVKKVKIHENYKKDKCVSEDDIALVQLKEPIDFNKEGNLRSVCLPDESRLVKDNQEVAMFSGWSTRSGSSHTKELHKFTLMSRETCNQALHNTSIKVPPTCICTSRRQGRQIEPIDEADFGGPLILKANDGRFEQLGVALSTSACDTKNTTQIPFIYTDISKYIRWIDKVVELSNTCH